MNTRYLTIKKMIGSEYTHAVYIVGQSSTPVAYVKKHDLGYSLYTLDREGRGTHDTKDRVKLAVIEQILNR